MVLIVNKKEIDLIQDSLENLLLMLESSNDFSKYERQVLFNLFEKVKRVKNDK